MAIGATFANLAMPAIGRHSLKGIGKTGALVVKLCRLNSNHKLPQSSDVWVVGGIPEVLLMRGP